MLLYAFGTSSAMTMGCKVACRTADLGIYTWLVLAVPVLLSYLPKCLCTKIAAFRGYVLRLFLLEKLMLPRHGRFSSLEKSTRTYAEMSSSFI
jgi:hypothetical protein